MKKLLWGLFSVFLCLVFISPAGAMVWELGVGGNGHDYVVVGFEDIAWGDTWGDIYNLLGDGYGLATITSQAEQDFVESLLAGYSGEYWIGGFQNPGEADPEAGWNWVTGTEDWHYTNWASDEPNDYNGIDEMHLALWDKYEANSWKWNDEHNRFNIAGYIAESLPVPEPGTIVLMGLALVGLAGMGRKRFR